MTAAAAVEPTELEELMEAQAEAAHEREIGDADSPHRQRILPPRRRASTSRASTCSMATTMRSRT